ncbi:choice-of-anchor A family protein [Amycolatopsis thermoflava]|uniref:choice-of-anchor A family protein n=1 Tax=Amycolatopsis thermoflava TaxID=84480 RepID=UPI00381864ED
MSTRTQHPAGGPGTTSALLESVPGCPGERHRLADHRRQRHRHIRTDTGRGRRLAARWRGPARRHSRRHHRYAHADSGTGRPPTGTVTNASHQTTFTSADTSALRVFNVNFDLAGSTGDAQTIMFDGIAANATVLVNLLGGTRTATR